MWIKAKSSLSLAIYSVAVYHPLSLAIILYHCISFITRIRERVCVLEGHDVCGMCISCHTHHGMCTTFSLAIIPPAPMNHVKIFKGWPPRNAPSKLVQLWYKTFPPDQRGQVEMKKPTILIIKPVLHDLVRRFRFWRVKISGTGF